MTETIETRLAAMGLTLPVAGTPRGAYVPFVVAGNLVFVSGQGPRLNGELVYAGKVGVERTIEEGCDAARLCALNLLAHLRVACAGDFARLKRVVRLAGLVNCGPDFAEHPRVINGASDLFLSLFGERGQHARIASGASSLPSQMTVEIEACFEIA